MKVSFYSQEKITIRFSIKTFGMIPYGKATNKNFLFLFLITCRNDDISQLLFIQFCSLLLLRYVITSITLPACFFFSPSHSILKMRKKASWKCVKHLIKEKWGAFLGNLLNEMYWLMLYSKANERLQCV